eukprot:SAG31_NODE_5027_length_2797_cov_2.821720_2_plen_256_part_00
MVGSDREDKAYALEVTYNYFVSAYTRQESAGLRRIEMLVDTSAEVTAEAAHRLGYTAKFTDVEAASSSSMMAVEVVGPDGYLFLLTPRAALAAATDPPPSTLRFSGVVIAALDPPLVAAWYVKRLGMQQVAAPLAGRKEGTDAVTLRFPGDSFSLTLERPIDGHTPVEIEQSDGRNAFSLPATTVRGIYENLSVNEPSRIVHPLQEIDEETGLGVLLIAIISGAYMHAGGISPSITNAFRGTRATKTDVARFILV